MEEYSSVVIEIVLLEFGLDTSNGKERDSMSIESQSNDLSMHSPGIDATQVHSSRKKKGNDGYYFECDVCDLGGDLFCCNSCPRTYHLEFLDHPLKMDNKHEAANSYADAGHYYKKSNIKGGQLMKMVEC